jgi:Tfp pilus assembly protein PilN
MIEINLLPPEMRKVDRTSLKRLLCMVVAVVLLSGSIIGMLVSVRRWRAESDKKASLSVEVARLEPLAKEYDVISSEIQEIEARISTISEIRSTRLRWGVKLDQLYAILPEYVWFDKIELKKGRATGAAAQKGAISILNLECLVAGADERKYAEFRRVLTGEVAGEGPYTGADFFGDFDNIGYSGWTREEFPATEEAVALKFDLDLSVKQLAAPVAPKRVVRPVVATN